MVGRDRLLRKGFAMSRFPAYPAPRRLRTVAKRSRRLVRENPRSRSSSSSSRSSWSRDAGVGKRPVRVDGPASHSSRSTRAAEDLPTGFADLGVPAVILSGFRSTRWRAARRLRPIPDGIIPLPLIRRPPPAGAGGLAPHHLTSALLRVTPTTGHCAWGSGTCDRRHNDPDGSSLLAVEAVGPRPGRGRCHRALGHDWTAGLGAIPPSPRWRPGSHTCRIMS